MTAASVPSIEPKFGSTVGAVVWRGRALGDAARVEAFFRDAVATRLGGDDDALDDELRAAATTGMTTEFVERFLRAVPTPKPWEVGEVLAECLLTVDDSAGEVVWPWNSRRDRKTPRASLPGADLVGLCKRDAAVFFLLGEVKTSSDASAPPSVMMGGSGMVWQLCENASRFDIQHELLKWLRSRCSSPELRALFRDALQRFVASTGKELLLVGMLLRDTQPNELDLKNRASALADVVKAPAKAELTAVYVPLAIHKWAGLVTRAP